MPRGFASHSVDGKHVVSIFDKTVKESFVDNLLGRIHFIIEMIWWTDLAPWEFEFPFPGSRISTFVAKP